ncbi:MAG: hypothetical protein KDE54_02070, partial [Caldilineaceae bacterium]|nr:hypothetical protein [Caldilineaceae bacterium]
MDYQKLLAYFQAKQPEMLDVIKLLVTHETPSGDKPRLDAFAALLAERLRDAGAQVELIPNESTGMHVRATFDNQPADNRPADTRPAL